MQTLRADPARPAASASTLLADLGLDALPRDGEVALLSPPQSFDGGEDAYEAHIGGRSIAELHSGHGAWRMARALARRPIERWLEIGAGGGACTLGLIDAAEGAQGLVTDTSPAFLRIIQRKLAARGWSGAATSYMTLAGEDLERLPAERLDMIVVASAVHHVTDWRAFLAQSARLLRPGGVFLMQEPFREGNLMMAMAIDVVLSDLWPKSLAISASDRGKLDRCRESIYFLADSAARKDGEDKHNFLVDDVVSAAAAAGFAESVFYANAHFADLPPTLSPRRLPCSLTGYLEAFLRHHHLVSDEGLERIFTAIRPLMRRVDAAFMRGDGPTMLASVGLRR